jgi:hypothetical protein
MYLLSARIIAFFTPVVTLGGNKLSDHGKSFDIGGSISFTAQSFTGKAARKYFVS